MQYTLIYQITDTQEQASNYYNSIIRQKPNRKMVKIHEQVDRNIQIANKHIRCSPSFVSKVLQMKTMRDHYRAPRMAKTKQTKSQKSPDNTKC